MQHLNTKEQNYRNYLGKLKTFVEIFFSLAKYILSLIMHFKTNPTDEDIIYDGLNIYTNIFLVHIIRNGP